MAAKCDMCGKIRVFGHNVSHSKRATNRHWKPNLQRVTIKRDDSTVSLRVCSRCLRTLHKSA